MGKDVEDVTLFDLPTVDAYTEIMRRAFPDMDSDAEDNDFTHLISPESLLDEGYNVFLIESGTAAKLICGSDKESLPGTFEFKLNRGEVQVVIREAVARWKTI